MVQQLLKTTEFKHECTYLWSPPRQAWIYRDHFTQYSCYVTSCFEMNSKRAPKVGDLQGEGFLPQWAAFTTHSVAAEAVARKIKKMRKHLNIKNEPDKQCAVLTCLQGGVQIFWDGADVNSLTLHTVHTISSLFLILYVNEQCDTPNSFCCACLRTVAQRPNSQQFHKKNHCNVPVKYKVMPTELEILKSYSEKTLNGPFTYTQ